MLLQVTPLTDLHNAISPGTAVKIPGLAKFRQRTPHNFLRQSLIRRCTKGQLAAAGESLSCPAFLLSPPGEVSSPTQAVNSENTNHVRT